MKGAVKFFNVAKGLGFITGEDGVEYFVHESSIGMLGLRILLPDWVVEFDPMKTEKGPQAGRVRPLGTESLKVVFNDDGEVAGPPAKLGGPKRKTATLQITKEGAIDFIDGAPVSPQAEAEGHFRAYYVGDRKIDGFSLELPVPEPERVFLLLNPGKARREMAPDGRYTDVPPGSYLLMAETEKDEHGDHGHVTIWNLGRRFQKLNDLRQNWTILEERFNCSYELSSHAPSIPEQTPTSDLVRDNDGFVPAIETAFAALEALRKETETKATETESGQTQS